MEKNTEIILNAFLFSLKKQLKLTSYYAFVTIAETPPTHPSRQ
jgi:hypothetical protein